MQILAAKKYDLFSHCLIFFVPFPNAAASIPTTTVLVRSHLNINAFLSAFGSAFTPERSASYLSSSSSSSSSMPAVGADAAGLVQPPPLTPQAAAARRMPLDSVESSATATSVSKSTAATATVTTTATARLRAGDRVRVALPAGQTQPRYKWGSHVNAESIGTVRRIDVDGDVIVSFGADAPTWRAVADELHVVATDGSSSSASALVAEPLPLRVCVVLPAGQRPARERG